MMYPFMTLNDDTEITHSEMKADGKVKVYIETPDEFGGFHNATCWLPDYKWEDIEGYSEEDTVNFRGISRTAFDGHGNYTLGIKEKLIFPEIEYDNILKVRGMDIVFVTSAKTNHEAESLLRAFGMPFRG